MACEQMNDSEYLTLLASRLLNGVSQKPSETLKPGWAPQLGLTTDSTRIQRGFVRIWHLYAIAGEVSLKVLVLA